LSEILLPLWSDLKIPRIVSELILNLGMMKQTFGNPLAEVNLNSRGGMASPERKWFYLLIFALCL
jgi:hypothetical protein